MGGQADPNEIWEMVGQREGSPCPGCLNQTQQVGNGAGAHRRRPEPSDIWIRGPATLIEFLEEEWSYLPAHAHRWSSCAGRFCGRCDGRTGLQLLGLDRHNSHTGTNITQCNLLTSSFNQQREKFANTYQVPGTRYRAIGERVPMANCQLPIAHSSRLTAHGLRLTAHGLRPTARLPVAAFAFLLHQIA
jgi:hypothetical protein